MRNQSTKFQEMKDSHLMTTSSSLEELAIYQKLASQKKVLKSSKFSEECQKNYQNEIFKYMIIKQDTNRFYNPRIINKIVRDKIVDWLIKVSKQADYKRETLHLSIAIVDSIFSRSQIKEEEIFLIIFVSLYLSVKHLEHSHKIPLISQVVQKFEDHYTVQQFKKCEQIIFCQFLNYNMNVKTVYSYINQYLKRGVVWERDFHNLKENIKDQTISLFEDSCLEIAFQLLYCYQIYKYSISAIASAIVILMRSLFGFEETWNESLQEMTKFKQSLLLQPSQVVLMFLLNRGNLVQKLDLKIRNMSRVGEKEHYEEVQREEEYKQEEQQSSLDQMKEIQNKRKILKQSTKIVKNQKNLRLSGTKFENFEDFLKFFGIKYQKTNKSFICY